MRWFKMNRDCSIESLSYRTTDGGTVIRLSDLQDWMTDKKIIKRGLQPHPCADVLHEWIEGAIMEQKFSKWHKTVSAIDLFKNADDLRIKPSEPIYEWQFDTKLPDGTWQYYKEGDKTHFTDEGLGKSCNWLSKVEHTRRERK